MPDAKRTFKIITEQRVLEDAESPQPGFPLRHWSMQICLIHQESKQDVPAECIQKVKYMLHPSFEARSIQVMKNPPFKIEEDGWGEFEVELVMTDLSGRDHPMKHDLNFSQERYENKQVIVFKNPKGDLATALRASGAVPGHAAAEMNGKKGGRASGIGGADGEVGKKKKKNDMRGIDMDSLAERLQKLGEDDLLQVVQMVHDNKLEESWMRNDLEQGEFHVDLYTLPDSLIKMLWEFTNEKVGIS